MKNKKFIRMCIVCRERRLKHEFIRIVKYKGEFKIDRTGKANGRGAYLCKITVQAKARQIMRRKIHHYAVSENYTYMKKQEFSPKHSGKFSLANLSIFHLHRNERCLTTLQKKRSFNHAFRCNVPKEIYEEVMNCQQSQESAV